jgi:hypothetical protein
MLTWLQQCLLHDLFDSFGGLIHNSAHGKFLCCNTWLSFLSYTSGHKSEW